MGKNLPTLTPDQFQFDAAGNVVINHDEVAEIVSSYETGSVAPPEAAIKIAIDIS